MTLGISITIFKWSKLAFYACLPGQFFFFAWFSIGDSFEQYHILRIVVMRRDGGYRYCIIYSFIQLFYYFSFYFVIIIIIIIIIIIVLFIIFGRYKTGRKIDMLCEIVKGRRPDSS